MEMTQRFEAHCDHCRRGVLSRDFLALMGHERLCADCCRAREAMEHRIRSVSGWLLLGCVLLTGSVGCYYGSLIGLFPGAAAGLIMAAVIEARLRRY